MKYSGVQWIGDIPKTWNVIKVKECFYISKEKAHQESPVVLSLARAGIKVRDISNNEGQLAASYEDYNPVIPGDLLLNPMDLYSGANCNVSEVSGVISSAYINLRKKRELNPKFFDYFFKTQYWTMAMFAHGKGVSFDNRWTMNAETVLNYYLPYPTVDEQNKIVDFLNKKCTEIDSLIKIENKQIEQLKEYKKAVITNAVTKGIDADVEYRNSGIDWIGKIPESFNMIPMKYLGDTRNGLTYSPKEVTSEEGILVLRSCNIKEGKLVLDDNVYVNCDIKSDLIVRKGDILICSRNGSKKLIGKNVLIDKDYGFSFGAFMMIFRPKYNSKYLYYILNSSLFSYYLGTYLTSTINQLTGSNFNNMIIPFCDDENTQNKIVSNLDNKTNVIDGLILNKQNKIQKLEEYKTSIIYEYVTGKKEVY